MTPALFGTPLSHFTRKVRILLAELEVPFEMRWAPTVMTQSLAHFAGNPLRRIPAWMEDGETVWDSDHIARLVVRRYDPKDRLRVLSDAPRDANRLAVANGVMANEVVILLARRTGLGGTEGNAYFQKLHDGLAEGLAHLDAHTDPDGDLAWSDVAAICAYEHVAHWTLVPGLDRFEKLAALSKRHATRPSFATTSPTASLAQATKDGWVAGLGGRSARQAAGFGFAKSTIATTATTAVLVMQTAGRRPDPSMTLRSPPSAGSCGRLHATISARRSAAACFAAGSPSVLAYAFA